MTNQLLGGAADIVGRVLPLAVATQQFLERGGVLPAPLVGVLEEVNGGQAFAVGRQVCAVRIEEAPQPGQYGLRSGVKFPSLGVIRSLGAFCDDGEGVARQGGGVRAAPIPTERVPETDTGGLEQIDGLLEDQ